MSVAIDVRVDKCCICGKVLFINGKRQKKLCYQVGLIHKKILDNGCYADGSEAYAYICKSCFTRENNNLIMETLWNGYKYSERIRKQREKEFLNDRPKRRGKNRV